MPQRGSFIVIEGLDRSGKTTQCQILYETLQRELGVDKVNLIKFPDRTTPIGKMIDSYLRSTSDLDDRAIHLLFSANRWEASSSIIAQLSEGVTLICDRYAFSGVSFSASKGLDYDWCAAPDVGLPAPDTVIFLDISPDQARLRGGYGEERYEREEIQRKVRETFKRMGDKEHESGRWTEIDAGREREVVAHDIFEIVHKTLLTSKDDVGKLWERIH